MSGTMNRTSEATTTYTGLRPSTTPPTASQMGLPAQPQHSTVKKLDISTLLSPPDPVSDSFRQTDDVGSNALRPLSHNSTRPNNGKQPLPISPPTSPNKQHALPTLEAGSQTVRDPVLFPHDDHSSDSSPSSSPLFVPVEPSENRRLVDLHVRHRPLFPGSTLPPRPEDYELVLHFKAQVHKRYAENPKAWLRKERAFLHDQHKAIKSRYPSIAPRAHTNASPLAKAAAVNRIAKPKKPTTHGVRTQRAGEAKPSATKIDGTPEPARRIVAPNREDKDYALLPDLCPPLDTLGSNPNCMKIDWKGQPLDLSKDPDAGKLHPAELALAANLRLDCATYLTSKRRMFIRRLKCLEKPKEFRKTDAQQACKIDVNKASKLWTAFDKVGWLDARWVRPFEGQIAEIE